MSNRIPSVGTLVEAVAFAADKHRAQRRKDIAASPYINHPIALANVRPTRVGSQPDGFVCRRAARHSEDTDTTEQELAERFGNDITSVVMEVTDDKSLDKARRKELQIEHAPHMSLCGAAGETGRQDQQPAGHLGLSACGLVH